MLCGVPFFSLCSSPALAAIIAVSADCGWQTAHAGIYDQFKCGGLTYTLNGFHKQPVSGEAQCNTVCYSNGMPLCGIFPGGPAGVYECWGFFGGAGCEMATIPGAENALHWSVCGLQPPPDEPDYEPQPSPDEPDYEPHPSPEEPDDDPNPPPPEEPDDELRPPHEGNETNQTEGEGTETKPTWWQQEWLWAMIAVILTLLSCVYAAWFRYCRSQNANNASSQKSPGSTRLTCQGNITNCCICCSSSQATL